MNARCIGATETWSSTSMRPPQRRMLANCSPFCKRTSALWVSAAVRGGGGCSSATSMRVAGLPNLLGGGVSSQPPQVDILAEAWVPTLPTRVVAYLPLDQMPWRACISTDRLAVVSSQPRVLRPQSGLIHSFSASTKFSGVAMSSETSASVGARWEWMSHMLGPMPSAKLLSSSVFSTVIPAHAASMLVTSVSRSWMVSISLHRRRSSTCMDLDVLGVSAVTRRSTPTDQFKYSGLSSVLRGSNSRMAGSFTGMMDTPALMRSSISWWSA